MGNVPFKIDGKLRGLNELRALNTTDRSISPGCHEPHVIGSRAPEGSHTSEDRADPSYSHFCRPEPTREFPFKNAEADRYREKQGGMQEDTSLKRASNGGVIGSQVGVKPNKGPGQQQTEWGEYDTVDQWNRDQEHTYGGKERNEPYDD